MRRRPKTDRALDGEDYLILSAIHSRVRWKAVFVLNVVDGCIPSAMSTGNADDIEEKRRLLYVAMTRAKDQLTPHRSAPLLRAWANARR